MSGENFARPSSYGVSSKAATDMLAYQYHKSYGMHRRRQVFTAPGHAVGDAPDFVRCCTWLSTIRTKCHPGGKSEELSWTSATSVGR